MTQTDRPKARRIFMDVADLNESDRAAALDRACGGDPKLRAEVETLLKADAAAGGFMKSPTADQGDASKIAMHFESVGAFGGEAPDRQIGPYKLLEAIGEGGFGTVWMAEQREPVKRRVAVKLIKLGMDTKQVIARFEAERQALAMMDHPNIAKVFDAGATETGRPYFVMEYIRGIPILAYCDQERLTTHARLELFATVCHAIQHAHQKGIIHRDIKPSNVLVTLHDGVAVPKVIDFGVAKATNSELTTKTLFTEHRQLIGTPTYMSPEQAEMSGLDIDTRSDIYSLGVLLHELLTGTTPFDVYGLLSKGYEQMMRTIREVEPPKPSTRVSTLGEDTTRTAQARRVDTKALGSLLRGDLDWIVMKCLEKDRARRYETANGLAADLKRHLNDEPVVARPPSAGYKLRKFARRNRAGVAVGAVLFATLLAGVIAFARQAEIARDQRDLAVQAKEAEARGQEAEAKKQAAIADAVAKFQTDMLAAVDPNQLPRDPVTKEPLKDAVTVVQAMTAAVKVLDEGNLRDQPLVEARVRDTIGNTLRALGRYAEAEPSLRKALALRRAALPAGHPEIAVGLNSLALLLQSQNKPSEAEPLSREALQIRRATLPPGHPLIATSLNNLAGLLMKQDRLVEAEPLLREALEIRRKALPAEHPDVSSSKRNLAELLAKLGNADEALPLLRESLQLIRDSLPEDSPELAAHFADFGLTLLGLEAWDEAEPILRECLVIREKAQPDEWRTFNARSLLGGAVLGQKKLVEAEPLLLKGYRGMKEREASIPTKFKRVRITEALERLVLLYEAKGDATEAAAWRGKLEAARAAEKKPAGDLSK